MTKIISIPDSNHVLRWARPNKHLVRNHNNVVVACDHSLFMLRSDDAFIAKHGKPEKSLSVNWVEYFEGSDKEKLQKTVADYQKGLVSGKLSKNDCFSQLNVGALKEICHTHKAKPRIVHDAKPKSKIKSHGSITQLPQDNSRLLEDLCVLAFETLNSAEKFIK